MRTLGGVILVVAFCLPFVLGAPVFAEDISVEDEVWAAVERLGKAYRDADVSTLRALLMPDYVHVNGGSGSRMGRDQWLRWVASQKHLLDGGELHIEAYEISDARIQVYGNMAVVTGTVRSEGVRSGEPFHVNVRFTNVWVLHEGKWRRAAFHDSPIPEDDG